MKNVIIILSLLNGGYMLADGIYVMLKGKYIGPDKPGPWAIIFNKAGIDVFRLGLLFIIFGVLWLTFLAGFLTQQTWAYMMGIAMSLLTLWYLPAGTVFSIAILALLLISRR